MKISIEAMIKNPEIRGLALDHLRTKTMCKHALKKMAFAIRYNIRVIKCVSDLRAIKCVRKLF